jgi:hypothetical protein
MLIVAGSASATTIDFEHADANGTPGGINYDGAPVTTQGFAFSSNMFVIDVTDGVFSGEGPAHSGSFAVLNDLMGALTLTAANAGAFTLQDFWIHGFYGETYDGSVTGYLNGVQVGAVSLSTGADWQNIAANFARVDQVVIDGGGSFLVDDINATISASDVPEPASLALFGLGLAGLGALRRKSA